MSISSMLVALTLSVRMFHQRAEQRDEAGGNDARSLHAPLLGNE